MFTLAQIHAAHSKVKSGADFPAYIQELKNLGVTAYEAFVRDGHIIYYGEHNEVLHSPAKYEAMNVSPETKQEQFKSDLLAHQQGNTDYPTFCKDCATSGIEKWEVNLGRLDCTYYGLDGDVVLVERIPEKLKTD